MFLHWLTALFLSFCLGDGLGILRPCLVTGSAASVAVPALAALLGVAAVPAWRKGLEKTGCLLLCGAMVLTGWYLGSGGMLSGSGWDRLYGQQAVLEGEIDAATWKEKEEGFSALFKVEKGRLAEEASAGVKEGQIRLFISLRNGDGGKRDRSAGKSKADAGKKARRLLENQLCGRKLRLRGKVKPLVFLSNPGCYDGELSSAIRGIRGRMTVSPGQVGLLGERSSLMNRTALLVNRWKSLGLTVLGRCGSGDTGETAVLIGMLLGGYQGIDHRTAEIFRDNGMAHLLSVSGTHVALLTAFLWLLLRKLGVRRRRVPIILLLVIYAVVCGLRPAVLRAVLMAGVILWCRDGAVDSKADDKGKGGDGGEVGTGPKIPGLRLLMVTAWALLLYRPLWLADISFQLSFLSVAGIMAGLSGVRRRLPDWLPEEVATAVAVTLTAQLATMPLMVHYFHRVSPVSFLSNVLLIPLLEIAVFLFLPGMLLLFPASLPAGVSGTGVMAVQGLLEQGAGLLFLPAGFLLHLVLAAGEFLGSLPGAVTDVMDWGILRSCCYLVFVAVWLDAGWLIFLKGRVRRLLLIGSGGIFLAVWGWQVFGPRPLTIHFADVGQGDAAIVMTPSGHNFLVDAGGISEDFDTGKNIIVPYLRYLGIRELDGVWVSHSDYDHVGGLPSVLELIPVKEVLVGNEADPFGYSRLGRKGSAAGKGPASEVKVLGRPCVRRVAAGEVLDRGGCRFRILLADSNRDHATEKTTDPNAASVMMVLEQGGRRILFTGDADGEMEEAVADRAGQVDFLKVSHHGSGTASTALFLHKVRTPAALVSCGRGNRHGHPRRETLERLEGAGVQVLRTDLLGAVTVEFGGTRTRWRSHRGARGEFRAAKAGKSPPGGEFML